MCAHAHMHSAQQAMCAPNHTCVLASGLKIALLSHRFCSLCLSLSLCLSFSCCCLSTSHEENGCIQDNHKPLSLSPFFPKHFAMATRKNA